MLKTCTLILFILFFTACSSSKYVGSFNEFNLKLPNNEDFKLNLSKAKFTEAAFSCTTDAFMINEDNLKYGKLFIEYIDLDSQCKWNSQSKSTFIDALKTNLRLKNLTLENKIAFENYEFSTYLINDKEYIDLIFVENLNETTFVLDYQGSLSLDLIKKFDPTYTYKYLNKKRFSKPYRFSLARANRFYGYFSKVVLMEDEETKKDLPF